MNVHCGFKNSYRIEVGLMFISLIFLLCIFGGTEFENLESCVPRSYELKFISTGVDCGGSGGIPCRSPL